MMCISSFIKYMMLSIVVGTLIIFSIFFENLFYALPAFVFSIIWSRITCPKCNEPILKDQNDWYMFSMRPTCRHCGQNTMLCEIESDAITNARLKK